ncbi:MAG TPA: methyltransferase domain-containing protein [Methanoregulaceae archaeon]|nr:MAG: methyltransferase domain-containing protein [Methanolinea sp.]HON82369.1 methyltransferase domain-containing protein [Methanoregulaceae archaeon]HPD11163.1 methyltransferase domain-containing protein [Methanoregulaceae archaeon]HRT16187.1 methyltransferase domain-containing protein [Methanoregulaceae archaeon]HRU31731.1 methyltransferase domain-containing protein [Methanoregulaceae archaeon]
MEQDQWALRVPRSRGEIERQRLARAGLLDQSLRPGIDGDTLLIPVVAELEGAQRASFQRRARTPELPRHELIGGIAVMLEENPAAAEELLASRPSLHTVLFPVSDVEGEYRTRRFRALAGKDTTRTTCTEFGKRFAIDLAEAYFSARLATERQRIVSRMGEGERVLDLFAGVGPFALSLADRASLVVAVDINPGAVRLLVQNIRLNRAGNVLPFLADASRVRGALPWTFDRIVMNHPTGALPFLREAFALCRPGGSIHCYVLQEREGEALPEIRGYPVKEVCERYVRSYSPGKWHAVYDIVVG